MVFKDAVRLPDSAQTILRPRRVALLPPVRAAPREETLRQQMDRSTGRLRTSPQSFRPAGVQGPGGRGRGGADQVRIVGTNALHIETLGEGPRRANGCSLARATLAASLSKRATYHMDPQSLPSMGSLCFPHAKTAFHM